MTDVAEHARLRRHFPALGESARVVGSVQIRNRATLAGNICNASPAADTASALLVHGAAVNLASAIGRRSVALADFFHGPGRTALTRGEILESVDLPLPSTPVGDAFGCHRDAMVVAGAVDAHVPAAAGGDQVAAFAACEVQLQVGTGFSVCVAGASGRPLEL